MQIQLPAEQTKQRLPDDAYSTLDEQVLMVRLEI